MNKCKAIYIVGYLGYETSTLIYGGQLTKTRYVYKQLSKEFGIDNVHYIDTSGWKKRGFGIFLRILREAKNIDVLVLAPNRSGMKILFPLFTILKKLYKFRIVYPVIGSWIPSLLEKNKLLLWGFKGIDLVLPETEGLKKELSKYTKSEISVQPTASLRIPINESDICEGYEEGDFYFCTFSRVTKEKGIEEAIEGINIANEKLTEKKCYLDIWGYIDAEYKERFDSILKDNNEYIRYKGEIDINLNDYAVTSILKNYYMLLFPTYYPGEGYPTTVVEAYMSALPVIASDWKYNNELIKDGCTGRLVDTKNAEDLSNKIVEMVNNPSIVSDMKKRCLLLGKQHKPEVVMRDMIDWIRSE